MSRYKATIRELIQEIVPTQNVKTGTITQVDADTVRVAVLGSTAYVTNVRVIGTLISDVSVGDKVELSIINGKPYCSILEAPSAANETGYYDDWIYTNKGLDTSAIDTPTTYPAVNRYRLFFKSDGGLYKIDSAGVETVVSSPAASSISGSGSTGRIAFWDGPLSITSSASLLYDDVNKELSIAGSIEADKELIIKQIATPSNPAAGYNKLYPKSDDHWYTLTSAGVETQVDGGGSGGSSAEIAGRILLGV